MWICKKCGCRVESSFNFCPNCGSKKPAEKRERSGVRMPIWLVILITAVVVGSLTYAFSSGGQRNTVSSNSSSSSQSTYQQSQYQPYVPYQQTQPEQNYQSSTPTPYYEVNMPTVYRYVFSKNERTPIKNFKKTQTAYNRFAYELTDCVGIDFYYTAKSSNGVGCTGLRDVYVRSYDDEINRNDDGWIYVGSFNYDVENQSVEVSLSWDPLDVYAVAAIRHDLDSYASYTASWGENVTFYAYY